MGSLYPGRDPPPPASVSPEATRIVSGCEGEGPGPYVMACDTLAGDAVVNSKGERLGTLAHIMLDVPSGRVAYAVVARGGVMGLGERLHAVPWAALALDAARHRFVLDVEPERMDSAPGFDRDHWPERGDRSWCPEADRFFEREAARDGGSPLQ